MQDETCASVDSVVVDDDADSIDADDDDCVEKQQLLPQQPETTCRDDQIDLSVSGSYKHGQMVKKRKDTHR
jgi:hypothetical protein